MRILAIETSCDETAITIVDYPERSRRAIADFKTAASGRDPLIVSQHSSDRKKFDTLREEIFKINVLSNIVSSQVKLHAKFGGVVPNLAKREHQKNLVPILLKTLKEAKLLKLKSGRPNLLGAKSYKLKALLEREQDLFTRIVECVLPLKPPKIDAIAVTYGPGLEPALWVGINFAKALSYIWGLPIIPVDHMAGHLYSALINSKFKNQNSKLSFDRLRMASSVEPQFKIKNSDKPKRYTLNRISFPALALLVSGGHTELILMRGWNKFKIVGETLDDAAGEAFDKVARLLGLPYPGGPAVSALAEEFQITKSKLQTNSKLQNPNNEPAIKLPRPMINSSDFNFSFSGLKTAVLYLVRNLGPELTKKLRPAIAAEFQNAVVDVLISKTTRAAKKYKVETILLGGGVAANDLLRKKLRESCQLLNLGGLIVNKDLSGDNALMIATAAYFKHKSIDKLGIKKTARKNLRAVGNLRLKNS